MKSLFFLFFFLSLNAVDERDWVKDWPYRTLKGFEEVETVSMDEIENYDFSITYALDGGRFGDQLTNYLRALWISWKYNLPFYYRSFDFSESLCLDNLHPLLNNEGFHAKLEYFDFLELDKSKKVFSYLDSNRNGARKAKKLIWNIGLLTPFIEEHFCEKLDDEAFRKYIEPYVKPKNPLKLIDIPEGRKSIALHVRTGEGYDWQVNIDNMPTKFPPDSFYLAALSEAFKFFEGEPLYIYLFTDHSHPESIKSRFIHHLTMPGDVVFECRKVNSHNQNVLEDLLSMTKFDAILHPDSSISRLAVTLSAPLFEVKPSHWAEVRRDNEGNRIYDEEGRVIVDPFVIIRSEKGKPIVSSRVYPIELK